MKENQNIPFSPKKIPFFYGYIVLLVGTFGILLSVPGQTVGVSVFTDYLIEAMNLERFDLSLAYMIGTIISALFLTKAGKIYDKFGARKSTFIVSILMGLNLILLSQIDKLNVIMQKHIGYVSDYIVAFILMVIGFFSLRFLGQGCLTLFSRNMIQKWFDKRRGLANAVTSLALSYGFNAAPLFFSILIKHYDWNGSWNIMGIFILLILPIIVITFYRDNPFDCDLKPDGGTVKIKNKKIITTGEDLTLEQAQKTVLFWTYSLGLALNSLFGTALTFHIISIFSESGLSQSEAIGIFIPSAFISIAISFIGSWVADYIELKWHLITMMLGISIASIGLLLLTSSVGIYLVILGQGIAIGIFSILSSVVWPRFFGIKYLGQISGRNMSILVLASAIGPALFGFAKDKMGGYYFAEILCLSTAVIVLILAIFFGSPKITKE